MEHEGAIPMNARTRMIFDLSAEMQMAIRLKAAKTGKTNADVIYMAMERAFPQEVQEAKAVIENDPDVKQVKGRRQSRKRTTGSLAGR
jgi:hypothetical protein